MFKHKPREIPNMHLVYSMLSLNELLIVLFKEKNEVKEYMTGKVYNKKVFLEQSLILITAEEKESCIKNECTQN